jgi:hypothetical protein
MSELTKQQLTVENNSSFPNNNTGFITPTLLRDFNQDLIDSLVDEVTYNADSASWTSDIAQLEQFSASLDANFVSTAELNASSSTLQNNINTKLNTSSFNAYTASQEVISASFDSRINSVSGSGVNTGSLLLTASAVSNVITFTKGDGSTFPVTIATGSGGVSGDFVTTSSFNSYTASAASGVSASINAATSSLSASIAVTDLAQSSSIAQLLGFSSSLDTTFATDAQLSASASTLQNDINTRLLTSSFQTYTSSVSTQISALGANKVNYNSPVNPQTITGSLIISGTSTNGGGETLALYGKGDGIALHVYSGSVEVTSPQGTGHFYTNLPITSSGMRLNGLARFSGIEIIGLAGAAGSGSIFVENDVTASNLSASSNIYANTVFANVFNGTASFATQALSASFAQTASFLLGSVASASFATTASFALTASFAENAENINLIVEEIYTGEAITKGDPLYISGSEGAKAIVYKADAAVSTKMPVTYIASETIGAAADSRGIVLGLIEGLDLTGYVAGDTIYVAEGGGYSTSRPTGSNSITQLLGVVTKGGSGGKGLVLNPGPATLPNLESGHLWIGNGTNQPIPQTVSELGLATTGSNTFVGNQIISGNLLVTGSNINLEVDAPALSVGVTNVKTLLDATASGVITSTDITRLGAGPTGDLSGVRLQTLSGSDTSGDTLLSRVSTGVNRHTSTAMTGSVVNTSIVSTWATGSAGGRVGYTSQVNANAQSASATLTLTAGNAASNYAGGTASLQAGRVNIGFTGATITSTGSWTQQGSIVTSGGITVNNLGITATSGSINGEFRVNGSMNITGSNPTIQSGSLSGSLVSTLGDTYASTPQGNFIVTLDSASMASLLSGAGTNANTIYFVI